MERSSAWWSRKGADLGGASDREHEVALAHREMVALGSSLWRESVTLLGTVPMNIPGAKTGPFRPRLCEERNLLDSHAVTWAYVLVESVFLFIFW